MGFQKVLSLVLMLSGVALPVPVSENDKNDVATLSKTAKRAETLKELVAKLKANRDHKTVQEKDQSQPKRQYCDCSYGYYQWEDCYDECFGGGYGWSSYYDPYYGSYGGSGSYNYWGGSGAGGYGGYDPYAGWYSGSGAYNYWGGSGAGGYGGYDPYAGLNTAGAYNYWGGSGGQGWGSTGYGNMGGYGSMGYSNYWGTGSGAGGYDPYAGWYSGSGAYNYWGGSGGQGWGSTGYGNMGGYGSMGYSTYWGTGSGAGCTCYDPVYHSPGEYCWSYCGFDRPHSTPDIDIDELKQAYQKVEEIFYAAMNLEYEHQIGMYEQPYGWKRALSQFRRGRGHAQRKALQKDTRAGENVRPKELNVPDNKGPSHDMTASNHKPENANAPNNNKPTNDKTASNQNGDDKVGKRYYSGSPNTYQVEIMFADILNEALRKLFDYIEFEQPAGANTGGECDPYSTWKRTISRIKQRGQGRQALKDLKNMVENRKRELQKKQTNKTK